MSAFEWCHFTKAQTLEAERNELLTHRTIIGVNELKKDRNELKDKLELREGTLQNTFDHWQIARVKIDELKAELGQVKKTHLEWLDNFSPKYEIMKDTNKELRTLADKLAATIEKVHDNYPGMKLKCELCEALAEHKKAHQTK